MKVTDPVWYHKAWELSNPLPHNLVMLAEGEITMCALWTWTAQGRKYTLTFQNIGTYSFRLVYNRMKKICIVKHTLGIAIGYSSVSPSLQGGILGASTDHVKIAEIVLNWFYFNTRTWFCHRHCFLVDPAAWSSHHVRSRSCLQLRFLHTAVNLYIFSKFFRPTPPQGKLKIARC